MEKTTPTLGSIITGLTIFLSFLVAAHASAAEPATALTLSLNANQTEAVAGGTVHYSVSITNNRLRTAEDLTVSVALPEGIDAVLPVMGAQIMNDLIVWDVPYIYAGKNWSESFDVRLSPDLSVGDTETLVARVSAELEVMTGHKEIVAYSTIGVSTLPATGWATDILFVSALSILTLPLVLETRRKLLVASKAS